MNSKYSSLGVDVEKKGIESIRDVTDDLFPGSFCSVVKDPEDPSSGIILHEDGAGTKPIISYLCYKESGDARWFRGLSSDVIAMNVDDVICVGGVPTVFSDYVALNALKIRKADLLNSLAEGFKGAFSTLRSLGLSVLFCGGETADLPDIVRTFDISGTVYARVSLNKVVTGNGISPGDAIVGLRSGGRCAYEKDNNSGIMCNGITLVRHALLSGEYFKKYPEIGCRDVKGYYGRFKLDEEPGDLGMTVAEAALSQTRIYLPIAVQILRHTKVKAMIHNTGGGLTKCMRLGKNILYVKDNLPDPDPVFRLVQEESRESPQEMYRNFNMGVGMEIIVSNDEAEEVIKASEKYGVGAQIIGRCERARSGNSVLISSKMGKFTYP